MHGQKLPDGEYRMLIHLLNKVSENDFRIEIFLTKSNSQIPISNVRKKGNDIEFDVELVDIPEIKITVVNSELKIENISVSRK